MLTLQDRIHAVTLMIKNDCSITLVQREWRRIYSTNPPSDKTLRNVFEKFMTTGSVLDLPRQGRPSMDEDQVDNVKSFFEDHPTSSIRKASGDLEIPRETLRRTLRHVVGMRTFHYTVVQQLMPDDHLHRLEFCQLMKNKLQADPTLKNSLCFSDEATFHLNTMVNKHNSIIWGFENPKSIYEIPIKSPGVVVWAAIFHDRIIGPYFFDDRTVNQKNYLEMLKCYFIPELRRTRRLRNTCFQQDGAPPHWGLEVRAFLDAHFPGNWIGRSGSISWPPRSPDITPLDYYLWGKVKADVFTRKPQTVEQMKSFITQSIQGISRSEIESTFDNFVKRLDWCIQAEGGHFQQN